MNIDLHNYRGCINYPKARKNIMEMMEKCELIDVWREVYPEKRGCIWPRFDTSKQGPFDYLLISEQILQEIQGFRINPSYRPDHSMSLD